MSHFQSIALVAILFAGVLGWSMPQCMAQDDIEDLGVESSGQERLPDVPSGKYNKTISESPSAPAIAAFYSPSLRAAFVVRWFSCN